MSVVAIAAAVAAAVSGVPPGPLAAPVAAASPASAAEDASRGEVGFAWQPEQSQDTTCGRGFDCISPLESYWGIGLGWELALAERWELTTTIDVGRAVDAEDAPRGGFTAVHMRLDVTFDLGRTEAAFGAALRVSPVLAIGWGGGETALLTDIPGLALLVGWKDLWGEVQIPMLPSYLDPRAFFAGAGMRRERFGVEVGIAQFRAVGFGRGEMDDTGSRFGLWVAGSVGVARGLELTARLAVASPFSAVIGVAWRPAAAASPGE